MLTFDEIRKILLTEWDPMHVDELGCPTDEYEAYIPRIAVLLRENASQSQVQELLANIETKEMGVDPDYVKIQRAAQLLVVTGK